VAAKKSDKYPHQWPDGSWHSIPWTQTKQYQASPYAKGTSAPGLLPPPPVGTYDPAIDYNASASQRGYQYQTDDAATAYGQGKEDYGLDLGDLTRQRDWTLEDLGTAEGRLLEDYGLQTKELGRQFGILGRQQSERAAVQGVTSGGLLAKSSAVRGENQQREQAKLDLAKSRGVDDIGRQRTRTNTLFDQGKTRLDLGFGRQFGGYGGNQWTNPLTGQPMVGTLLTSLTRAGDENVAFQGYSDQARINQARDFGYIAPGVGPQPEPSKSAAAEFTRRIRGR